MRDTLTRPSPFPPARAQRAAQPSSEALRHRAVQLWAHHWQGAHAPAWASRDAFLAASACDPILSVDSWLAVTEPRAAWIAVEPALPNGRVRYLAHRHWDEWWPIWRMAAPRLGSYPVSALASWLDSCVRKGIAVDARPHLASPHPPDPEPVKEAMRKRWGAAGIRQATSYVQNPTPRRGVAARPAGSRPTIVIGALVVLGLLALVWAQNAQATVARAHLAPPATALALGLLGTALGLLHACAPLEIGEDQHLHIRRLWPMYLALLTWIPLIRTIA